MDETHIENAIYIDRFIRKLKSMEPQIRWGLLKDYIKYINYQCIGKSDEENKKRNQIWLNVSRLTDTCDPKLERYNGWYQLVELGNYAPEFMIFVKSIIKDF